MKTAVTWFSGGGLAALGLQQAGYTLAGAVEIDPRIAEVYRANIGPILVTDVTRFTEHDLEQQEKPDLFQVSPVCTEFSNAKTDGQETGLDIACADAIALALHTWQPPLFLLENVRGYARSESLRRIIAALTDLDYHIEMDVLCAADFGVPQTRDRLVLRARAGGWMQPTLPLPTPTPRPGWYAAIADLIPTLPESAFAAWQLARLPACVRSVRVPNAHTQSQWGKGYRVENEPAWTIDTSADHRAFLIGGGNTQLAQVDSKARWGDEPTFTVAAGEGVTRTRAWLVTGGNDTDPRDGESPAFTITGSPATSGNHRAWLDNGRVVSMTPRALARFQTLPDTYQLPDHKALACKVIGNGWPTEMVRRIAGSMGAT